MIGRGAKLGRRGALLLPLILGGCSWFDDLFDENKPKMPGRRESVAPGSGTLVPDAGLHRDVVLPPPVRADWPQPGGNAAHDPGSLAGSAAQQVWTATIGEGGGYREKITAQPLIANGRVFTMDSDAVVSAFDLADGRRVWRTETQAKKNRSSNVGGGVAVEAGRVYVSTGRGDLLALDAGSGKILWRTWLGAPARSAPTVAAGRVYLSTIDDRMLALDAEHGGKLWSYQAQAATTAVLGEPAPAYADGLVIGGFASGDLVALRAESGSVAWTDSLASAAGDSPIDLSAIRGLPVVANGRVYAVGLGGLMVALDLRSGRRLWERDIASGDSLFLAGDWIFVVTTDQQLAALTAADGQVRWVNGLPRYKNPEKLRGSIFWRGPIVAGGKVWMASTAGQLLSADPRDGKIVDEVKLPDAASLAPVAAQGMIFVLTDDGALTAFR